VALGCGYDGAGVPLGLQIAARRFDDMTALRLARVWEDMRPTPRDWPM
jgi:aspartyl-tRNA(Asn)/glutamyl-tRNA(Gln) amidotransferase subunit A